jgi:ribosome maturation factor RimP
MVAAAQSPPTLIVGMSSESIASRIREAATPIAEELGLYVYDVEAGHSAGCTVRLLIDRVGGSGAPGEGVTIAEVTRVAKQVGYLIDTEDLVPFAHRFEVSSPGVERPLRTPEHFAQAVGQDVRIVCDPILIEGDAVVEGPLVEATPTVVFVDSPSGRREVPIRAVRRAKTVFHFGAAPSASRSSER